MMVPFKLFLQETQLMNEFQYSLWADAKELLRCQRTPKILRIHEICEMYASSKTWFIDSGK